MKDKGESEKNSYWVTFIDDIYTNHPVKTSKRQLQALAKNFYKGEQFKWIDQTTNSVIDVAPTRETRCIYNFVRSFVDVWSAKMTKNSPFPQASPHIHNTSRDNNDIARVANGLMASFCKRKNFSGKLIEFVRWAGKIGISVFKINYVLDRDKILKPGKDVLKKFGLDDLDIEDGFVDEDEGEIELDVVNPAYYYPDSVARNDDDRRFELVAFPVAKTIAEEKFGRKFKSDDKSEIESDNDYTTKASDGYDTDTSTKDSDIVIVKELNYFPCKKYKNGKHVIMIGKEIVVNEDAIDPGETPEEYELPHYTFAVNREDDEYFGIGKIVPIMMPQRDYNKSQATIMENMGAAGVIKTIINKQSGIDIETVTDDPRDIIEANDDAGKAYTRVGVLPLPEYITTLPDSIYNKAQQIMNLSQLDFSAMPPRTSQTTGPVVRELRESSEIAAAPEIIALTSVLKRIFFRYLRLVQMHYSVDKIAEIIGENMRPKIEKFKEAKLNDDSMDINIEVGQGYGQSSAARVEQVIALVQAKIFSPIQAMKAMRNYGNIVKLLDDTFLDEDQAYRNLDKIIDADINEIADYLSGKDETFVSVSQYANHDAHIKVFSDFTKTPEWEGLEFDRTLAIDRYINTMIGHKHALQMIMAPPQMGMDGQGNGGKPPSGGPPGPPPQPQSPMDATSAEENMHQAQGPPMGVPQGV